MTTVIDAHLHLSPQVSESAKVAAAALAEDLRSNNVAHGIVLHLQTQPWRAEDFAEALAEHPRLHAFVNIHPAEQDACGRLRNGIEKFRFIGLKLHPRLQRFDLDDPAAHRLVAAAGELDVPVLIDAFPDGDWLMMGFDPLAFARLAAANPNTRIIIAHFGGHHCLDFMMLAKRLPNVSLDLSYSLLYYAGSPVVENLLYCCRSMNYRRIFYGSDYPDRPVRLALDMSLKTLVDHGVAGAHLDALMWRNAAEFYGWGGLIADHARPGIQ
jgi:predicted TIM-barrel fold metal-dependent hydrolase